MLRMIRWTFPKLEKIAPVLAGKWAWKLFFTPFRFPISAKDQEFADQANKFTFEAEGDTIQGYEWGTGDKTIFLLHGWSGRATQWRSFITPLNDNGYKVVAIDGPAHGDSTGKVTDVIKYENVLEKVLQLFPEIDSMITHSFGGIAAMYAVKNGLPIRRLVNIGTPTNGDYVIAELMKRINASPKTGERFKQLVINSFGNPFDYYNVKETIKYTHETDLLIIHDKYDKEVPSHHSIDLHEANPKTQLFITEGLGHVRILKDKEVITQAIDFVGERVESVVSK